MESMLNDTLQKMGNLSIGEQSDFFSIMKYLPFFKVDYGDGNVIEIDGDDDNTSEGKVYIPIAYEAIRMISELEFAKRETDCFLSRYSQYNNHLSTVNKVTEKEYLYTHTAGFEMSYDDRKSHIKAILFDKSHFLAWSMYHLLCEGSLPWDPDHLKGKAFVDSIIAQTKRIEIRYPTLNLAFIYACPTNEMLFEYTVNEMDNDAFLITVATFFFRLSWALPYKEIFISRLKPRQMFPEADVTADLETGVSP